MIFAILAAFGASSAAEPARATITVCNLSTAAFTRVDAARPTPAVDQPIPIGGCVAIPGMALGPHNIRVHYSVERPYQRIACIKTVDVQGDITVRFDDTTRAECEKPQEYPDDDEWF